MNIMGWLVMRPPILLARSCFLLFFFGSLLFLIERLFIAFSRSRGSNFAQNSKCLESLQIERERRPCRHEPNATRLGSNGCREREISCSVQNDKQAKKKNVLTVQSVWMLTWQTVRHVAGNRVNNWHMTWLVCGEWDDDTWHYHGEWFGATWPRHGLPCGTL
jgi:hypothetical protein